MAKYMITGIPDDQWRSFKAACDMRGCTAKDSFLDHINIIVAGYRSERLQLQHDHNQSKTGGNKK